MIIERFCYSSKGTFGVMRLGDFMCYTVERPWVPDPKGGTSGKPYHSCMPEGFYELVPHNGRKYKDTVAFVSNALRVTAQPDSTSLRSACVIHAGNHSLSVTGCVAVGQQLSAWDGKWTVTRSRDTLAKVKNLLKGGGIEYRFCKITHKSINFGGNL